MTRLSIRAASLLLSLVAFICGLGGRGPSLPSAMAEEDLPKQVSDVGIFPRLSTQLPLDTSLTDQDGKVVSLRSYLRKGRPVVLTLNYYSCATLCSFLLNGLLDGLKEVGFALGKDFEAVTLSIDPREQPSLQKDLASKKRKAYLEALGGTHPEESWPFLTGTKENIETIAESLGFKFKYDAQTNQFAHAAGIFILTPEGRLSQVLYGITFGRMDLRLALVEASKGGISSPVEKLLLFCYHYDPQVRKYGLSPMGVMRIGGSLTVLGLFALLTVLWRRERRAPTVVHD